MAPSSRYNVLSRVLASIALVFVYFVSTSAVLVGTSTTPAMARGRGGGFRGGGWRGGGWRGGGWRGGGLGFRGRGWGWRGGGCRFSYRFGRVVCY